MSERFIYKPPDRVETSKPTIFLAGPIQGAPDWQSKAIEILHNLNPDVVITSPRRDSFDESFDYDEQVEWETRYLGKAGSSGVVLFWLAREEHKIPGRAYAQTTRFELAEWAMEYLFAGSKVVVGIEAGFSGAKYIRKRMAEKFMKIPVVDSLEEVCQEAIVSITK